ncbi:MAG: peptidoglycan-binding domain-containing protein, partial [Acidimicrobiia bacterium]
DVTATKSEKPAPAGTGPAGSGGLGFPSCPAGIMKFKSKGPGVLDLQIRLNGAGASPPLVPDGDFGSKTKAGVIDFQSKFGLVPDGVVGPNTCKTLDSIIPSTLPKV